MRPPGGQGQPTQPNPRSRPTGLWLVSRRAPAKEADSLAVRYTCERCAKAYPKRKEFPSGDDRPRFQATLNRQSVQSPERAATWFCTSIWCARSLARPRTKNNGAKR
jgi:hypothetical protein